MSTRKPAQRRAQALRALAETNSDVGELLADDEDRTGWWLDELAGALWRLRRGRDRQAALFLLHAVADSLPGGSREGRAPHALGEWLRGCLMQLEAGAKAEKAFGLLRPRHRGAKSEAEKVIAAMQGEGHYAAALRRKRTARTRKLRGEAAYEEAEKVVAKSMGVSPRTLQRQRALARQGAVPRKKNSPRSR